MARKSKITPALISKAKRLAKAGFSHKQIYETLGISYTTFYKNVELVETIKKAENELREKVSNALLERAVNNDDTTALIFLAKRLNLFSNNGLDITVNSTETALKGLSQLINANIPIEQKNSIKAIIEAYIKGVETVELDKRITKLEELLKNENK